jgi:arsenate reductase
MIQVYHNPRCTKSRECMLFLEESGQPYEIIKYLEDMPNEEELKAIIKKLGIKPIELVRQKESLWIEKFKSKKMTDNAIIKAMVANPILMERPIVVNGDKAVIARPLEKAADIL